jgi:hypothetical protein
VFVLADLRSVVVRPILLVRLPLSGRFDRDGLRSRLFVRLVIHLLRLRNRYLDSNNVLALEPGFVVGACAMWLYRVREHAILRLARLRRNPPQIALANKALRFSDCPSTFFASVHRCAQKRVSLHSFIVYLVDIQFKISRLLNLIFFGYTITPMKEKTKKVGLGRPPKGSGVAKSESLLLRLSPSEKQGFADAAQLAGIPLTVWIRERLRQVAAGELQPAGKPVAFLEK